jgi:hypothetical protein
MGKPAEKKESTGIFSIKGNPFEEGEIPGVTQLLTRDAQPKKASAPAPSAPPAGLQMQWPKPAAPGSIPILVPDAPEVTRSNIAIPAALQAAAAEAIAEAAEAASSGTRTNLVVPSLLQLKTFGVLFELKFHPEGTVFRFASTQGHKEARLQPWQEKLFDRMKMDKQSVPATEPFEEFTCRKHAFLFDAFGVHPDHFIQIVSPEYTNTRVVLVSERSVIEHAAAIVEHYSRS